MQTQKKALMQSEDETNERQIYLNLSLKKGYCGLDWLRAKPCRLTNISLFLSINS
jgi:hypothetical protein